MAEEQQPVRLMHFVSESKLQELKATRGATVEDGTLAPERPLHEILRENKQKQDHEFKERFKHRPPKALDEEEMEFLERLEMGKRQRDQQVADEEAQELSNFEAAVANRTVSIPEPKITVQQKKDMPEPRPKRPSQSSILATVIKVKPQPEKKAKLEGYKVPNSGSPQKQQSAEIETKVTGLAGLVAYEDESDED